MIPARRLTWGAWWSYAVGALAGFGVLAAAWGILFAASVGLPAAFKDRWLHGWYAEKLRLSRALGEQRKVVLAGGSNVFFGLDAERLGHDLGRPALNFGTHAALGLDYHLWVLRRRVLEPGDVVILSFEWEHFTRDPFEMNEVSAPYLLAFDPDYLASRPASDWLSLALAADVTRLLLPLRLSRKESAQIQEAVDTHVASREIGPAGDRIHTARSDQTEEQRRMVEAAERPDFPAKVNLDPAAPVWRRLDDFAAWCRKRGIGVAATFPSIMDDPKYRGPAAMVLYARTEENLRRLGIPVLTRQPETIFPADAFFDSFYHLNAEAREQRTALLARRLRESGLLAPAAPR